MKKTTKIADIQNYNDLLLLTKEIKTLKGVASLLVWDQETYMPANAIKIRAEQAALLDKLIHQKSTSRVYGASLKKLVDLDSCKILATTLSAEKKVAVKEWHRNYVRLTKLPDTFIEKFAVLTSEAKHAWDIARQENNFAKFKPFLECIVEMCQRKAELLGYKKHPYDALLDEYEPNWTTQDIARLFTTLKEPLLNLLKSIAAKQQAITDDCLLGNFAKTRQLKFSHFLLNKMGYNLNCGRLDLSAHPCTISLHPTDVRLTTTVDYSSIMACILAVIHEGGHGLYELGLPKEHFGSPLGEAVSTGIHESQSRLWETQVGQSMPFWEYFYPLLKKEFSDSLKNVSLNRFYTAINKVKPGLIRIKADEVTYNLHIILRFEIEKALIEGSLAVKDLPEIWNHKMRQYLDVTVKDDAQGCLQDIHWSMGAFGYFPAYTLGNLYAAQLFAAIKKQHPTWEKEIVQGNLMFITEWLNNNIYQYGKLYSSKELLKKATGKELEVECFVKYLKHKYQKPL